MEAIYENNENNYSFPKNLMGFFPDKFYQRQTHNFMTIDFMWNTADILHRPLNTDHLFFGLSK